MWTKSWLGQGFSHPVEPDVASALTIRMHKVVFPRLTHFSPKGDPGWGHRPAGWAVAPLGSWD